MSHMLTLIFLCKFMLHDFIDCFYFMENLNSISYVMLPTRNMCNISFNR